VAPPTTVDTSGVLKPGNTGGAVLLLQQQLTTLGYWMGTPDGRFGTTTTQAVYALQKAAGLPTSGTATAETLAALAAGTKPTAASATGNVIEVNLARNLLLFVSNGQVNFILNTSTGGGYVFYEKGVKKVALTPKGQFATNRVVDGPDKSPLGLLFRPRYFIGGIAIHGDTSVPARPVSHGCVRVSNAAINWIWATNADPIGTPVWVY
jgi:lipoprotein-anchoring transpeptidase ErfK/SrfK